MKKKLIFKVFGNKQSYITPEWSCLSNPDSNLIAYYDQVLNKPFSKKRFRRAGVFRVIDKVDNEKQFSAFENLRCLDMPIKMAGDKEYRIPLEFKNFIDPISKMISWENAHNKNSIDFYAYLTVDQTLSKEGEYHREPGCHVDGFQGARISPKVACDRSYIVLDCNCPSIWNQSFETVENMDDSTHNIFHEFDRTKHYSSEIKVSPYNIYFMDGYTVHSANEITNENKRTFLRLSYSARQFDRMGNSKNNCFDYNWEMVERSVAKSLI